MVPTGTRQTVNGNTVTIDYHFELHFDDGNHCYSSHVLTGPNGSGNPELVIEVDSDAAGTNPLCKLISLDVDTTNTNTCVNFDVKVKKGGTVVHTESHQADSDCGGMGGG